MVSLKTIENMAKMWLQMVAMVKVLATRFSESQENLNQQSHKIL